MRNRSVVTKHIVNADYQRVFPFESAFFKVSEESCALAFFYFLPLVLGKSNIFSARLRKKCMQPTVPHLVNFLTVHNMLSHFKVLCEHLTCPSRAQLIAKKWQSREFPCWFLEWKCLSVRCKEVLTHVLMLQNRGVYMFRIDSDSVIDATMAGGPARYINHSCSVSFNSKKRFFLNWSLTARSARSQD